MANKIANRKVICDTLLEAAETDKDIVVLCSDSRGSASLTPFFNQYPQQSVEVGIAEQDLVSIAAGMASCGKKAWAASPASFVTTRSYEQCKVDVSYSNTNVKLIGISGGVSYGALGMSHHSAQDIAAMSAIPNMHVSGDLGRIMAHPAGLVDNLAMRAIGTMNQMAALVHQQCLRTLRGLVDSDDVAAHSHPFQNECDKGTVPLSHSGYSAGRNSATVLAMPSPVRP